MVFRDIGTRIAERRRANGGRNWRGWAATRRVPYRELTGMLPEVQSPLLRGAARYLSIMGRFIEVSAADFQYPHQHLVNSHALHGELPRITLEVCGVAADFTGARYRYILRVTWEQKAP